MTRARIARAAVVAVALLAVAWFALGVVQSDDQGAAEAIVAAPHVTAAQARHADALLSDAATLQPGVAPEMVRAQLAARRGDRPAARRLAGRAAHSEPLNPEAWLLYVQLAEGTPQVNAAYRHLIGLVPVVPQRRS